MVSKCAREAKIRRPSNRSWIFVEENFRTNTRTTEFILRSRVKKALDFFGAWQDRHCAPIERTRPNPHCIRLRKRTLSTLGAAFAIVLLGLSGEQTYP